MNALILYHADCTDGAAAAWAARFHCSFAGYICTLVPAAPGECPPEAFARSWALVIAVDMCPPPEALAKLAQSGSVHVLDHHRTNRETVERWGVYDEARSGAGLAWDEVPAIIGAARLSRPWFINYIEDRDLWRFALPDSKAVNAALCFGERTVERVSEIAETWTLDEARATGAQILGVQAATVAQVLKHPILTTGFAFVCSAVEQSEIGAALVARYARPACVWYTREGDAGPVAQVSLRSRDDLTDVSDVAARLGGGGHRNAAGAVVPLARWFYELSRHLDLGILGSPVTVQHAARLGIQVELAADAVGPAPALPGFEDERRKKP